MYLQIILTKETTQVQGRLLAEIEWFGEDKSTYFATFSYKYNMTSVKVLIPVGEFHKGNTSYYVERAFNKLGIFSQKIDEPEFLNDFQKADRSTYFFCVDSGKPINLFDSQIKNLSLKNLSYWFIDFRHHKHGPRSPTDVELCKEISERGGTIFQSQYEDWQYCQEQGWKNSFHLPLAVDPEIWSNERKEEKKFNLAFAGNVWDKGRAEILQYLLNQKTLKFGFPGHGALWMEEAAKLIRQAQVGFNVNSWYGTEHAFDVNMRFYETLSCGVPLITNWVAELDRMFPTQPNFLRVYKSASDLPKIIKEAFSDPSFLNSGVEARTWVEEGNTYKHRMAKVLELLGE